LFVEYTSEEIKELLDAGSKIKKALPPTQEEKLFHSIKHVRLFDDMSMADIFTIIDDVKINKYSNGDTFELNDECKGRIFYVISGNIIMPLQSMDSHVEFSEAQIFGEVATFTGVTLPKIMEVSSDNTIVFSFLINKNNLGDKTARAFVKFYEELLGYMGNKLAWFELA
jgi:hypothetical protein